MVTGVDRIKDGVEEKRVRNPIEYLGGSKKVPIGRDGRFMWSTRWVTNSAGNWEKLEEGKDWKYEPNRIWYDAMEFVKFGRLDGAGTGSVCLTFRSIMDEHLYQFYQKDIVEHIKKLDGGVLVGRFTFRKRSYWGTEYVGP